MSLLFRFDQMVQKKTQSSYLLSKMGGAGFFLLHSVMVPMVPDSGAPNTFEVFFDHLGYHLKYMDYNNEERWYVLSPFFSWILLIVLAIFIVLLQNMDKCKRFACCKESSCFPVIDTIELDVNNLDDTVNEKPRKINTFRRYIPEDFIA